MGKQGLSSFSWAYWTDLTRVFPKHEHAREDSHAVLRSSEDSKFLGIWRMPFIYLILLKVKSCEPGLQVSFFKRTRTEYRGRTEGRTGVFPVQISNSHFSNWASFTLSRLSSCRVNLRVWGGGKLHSSQPFLNGSPAALALPAACSVEQRRTVQVTFGGQDTFKGFIKSSVNEDLSQNCTGSSSS